MTFTFSIHRYRLFILIVTAIILWHLLRNVILESPSDSNGKNEHGEKAINNEASQSIAPVKPVQIKVFYEALCPDSRSFFTKQLLPTFQKAPRLTDIVLIPYGKAKTNVSPNGYLFKCQHGPIECLANKIHACAIDKITQPDVRLKYITCMISDNMNPEEIGQTCAQKFNVNWDSIATCSNSAEGDNLVKVHGDATNALKPAVTFIPTILLNDSQDKQPAILKNLFKELCLLYENNQSVPECT